MMLACLGAVARFIPTAARADPHPDHDTLRTFRRQNQPLPTESFVKVLQPAQRLKMLKVGQLTVAAARLGGCWR